MLLGSNSVNGLNYLYHLVMGRLLGPAAYGELAALLSVSALIGIVPGSANLVIVKYISSIRSKEKLISLINWLKGKMFRVALIFCLIVIIVSPSITSFLHIEKLAYLVLIAISTPFAISALLNRAILQGLLKFKEMILSMLMENTIKLILSIVLVFIGFRVGGAMLALLSSSIIGWHLTTRFLNFKTVKNEDITPEIRSMFFFTGPILLYTIASTSLYSSDVILVKHFFSSHDAGLYASLSILGKIIFFATGPIGSAMFPIISQRQSKGMKYGKIFLYSFLATIIIALSILLIYWLFPYFSISILYGSAYLESVDLLVWFGIFISLFTLSSLVINFNLSLGKTRVVALPLIAAAAQIIGIWLYHKSLFEVILISITVSALLLALLLIYSSYVDKPNINNSTSI